MREIEIMIEDIKTKNENVNERKVMSTKKNDNSNQLLDENESQIFKIIVDKLKKPINEVDIYTSLFDMGVNSITFILIVVELESAFDIEFDDDMLVLENAKNIKALISYVCKKKVENHYESDFEKS